MRTATLLLLILSLALPLVASAEEPTEEPTWTNPTEWPTGWPTHTPEPTPGLWSTPTPMPPSLDNPPPVDFGWLEENQVFVDVAERASWLWGTVNQYYNALDAVTGIALVTLTLAGLRNIIRRVKRL